LGNFATVGRREVNAGPYAAFKAGDEGGDGGAGRRSNESGIKVFGEAIRDCISYERTGTRQDLEHLWLKANNFKFQTIYKANVA